ncbi:MAG: Transcriptional regulator, XRE family [Parcubacteria group bacterium GW2011_GWA1_40_21]|nr:MAG: Transcriptional regulator, XRE family [Parcubacteria group bacterium GW2011_GWC1_40_13]KKR53883.1 MAG: Transcriptional regulator, XRE family [Parcubacteria group bacterium GW2011_GWA1_40_21]
MIGNFLTTTNYHSIVIRTMSKPKSTIADNMKKYRHKLGISQDVLSKRANLAFHTIAKIEAGATPNPTIETVKKIAEALEISLDDLMKE